MGDAGRPFKKKRYFRHSRSPARPKKNSFCRPSRQKNKKINGGGGRKKKRDAAAEEAERWGKDRK